MKHCYDKLRDFAKVQWYEQNSIRFSSPEESHRYMVMGLILNGAKAEDEYCKALLRYLFKTYYKSLYKQLKRFNKISADEIISLSEIDECMDLGYPGDYLYRCMQNDMGLTIQFTRTLAVLRTVYPKREFTFEEVQRYAHLYSAISALVDVSEELDNVNREMLGLETRYATWEEDTFFIRRT